MGALNKFLVRARALRSTAASKAAKLAKNSSTNLSRIAFIGLIALAFMSSTESIRVVGPRLTANIEIVRTRPIPVANLTIVAGLRQQGGADTFPARSCPAACETHQASTAIGPTGAAVDR